MPGSEEPVNHSPILVITHHHQEQKGVTAYRLRDDVFNAFITQSVKLINLDLP